MASSCNLKYFQNPRLWLLALVSTAMWAFSAAEGAENIQISGEIGGNVTFPCPVDKQRMLNFFYVQRDSAFVNGYYEGKAEKTKPWDNTRVDRNERAVHMSRLNISHSGIYQCIIRYNDLDKKTVTTFIHLSVRANYSKPTFTMYRVDDNHGFGCLVTCASHGGYPETQMMFNVNVSRNSNSQMWKVVNSSEERNPATMMFDSSSTAYFNCSYGQLDFVSCSVGEITSDMFSVCTRKEKTFTPYSSYVMLAAAVAVVCLLVAGTIIMVRVQRCHKYKNRQTGAAECKVNTYVEEATLLSEITGKEAS